MPIDTVISTSITCDNPACPGNTLDPADKMGWLITNTEIYGEPVHQTVFCSYGCLGAAGTAQEEDPNNPPFPNPPEETEPPVEPPA